MLTALILASFGKILSKLGLIFYYKNSKNARLKFSKHRYLIGGIFGISDRLTFYMTWKVER
ncbi:hypothetical protein GXM_05731 [Nostoc sphaeroides CCNUC1]|uniref:Uncharacterized protein n=1 Tax=Nostoc sphaeroides CCNUC1 TaxID=2653204 RepID=A0A5P8W8F9_9NOSO|nr:hypothetical protein GXM_05731 [Nostoc sphaeroides CCNUC1]